VGNDQHQGPEPGPQPPAQPRRRWRLVLLVVALLLLGSLGTYRVAQYLWAGWHWRVAGQALARHDLAAAREHLARCLTVWPDNPETLFLAARTARRARAYEEANHLLKAYQDNGGTPAAATLERRLAQAQRGELAGVDEYLWVLVQKQDKDSPLVLEALAQGYIHASRWAEALNSLNRLVECWPEVADVYVWRGWVHESLRSIDQAKADYRQAVALNPENDDARSRLAELLVIISEFPEAADLLETLRQHRPDDPVVLLSLARCRIELNQLEEAEGHLSHLLALHPNDAGALTQRGRIAVLEGRFEEAEKWLREAQALAPWERDTNYQLQLCLGKLGKEKEAKEVGDRLLLLEEQQRRLEGLERQILNEPANRSLRYEAAMILLKYGHEREGVRRLQSLLRDDPQNASAHAALADYFQSQGDTARADFHRRQGR
jgi:tetratricopeptide (TPR) repeat protein